MEHTSYKIFNIKHSIVTTASVPAAARLLGGVAGAVCAPVEGAGVGTLPAPVPAAVHVTGAPGAPGAPTSIC